MEKLGRRESRGKGQREGRPDRSRERTQRGEGGGGKNNEWRKGGEGERGDKIDRLNGGRSRTPGEEQGKDKR